MTERQWNADDVTAWGEAAPHRPPPVDPAAAKRKAMVDLFHAIWTASQYARTEELRNYCESVVNDIEADAPEYSE